ncbi:MAG TPA: hypothetical protein VIA10_07315 [Gaiellaceae bacterium]
MEPPSDPIEIEELIREIELYLGVVAAFRAAGCAVGGIAAPERSGEWPVESPR